MKKILLTTAALMLTANCVYAAELPEIYRIEYGEASPTGYVPIKYVDSQGNEIERETLPSISLFSNLPSYYKNENVSPVRDQGSEGCCWAFASLGAIEASLIKQGLADKNSVDFSEAHTAYFGRNSYDEIHKDGTSAYGTEAYSAGGEDTYVVSMLSKWSGLDTEENTPYDEYTGSSEKAVEEEKRFISHAGIKRFFEIDPTDINSIKQDVYDYGAVTNGYYFGNTGTYMNKTTHAYHYDGETVNPNHETLIVGWDDNFPKENFNEAHRPSSDGAWIVRNSWGTDWQDGGYFYMSYETELVMACAYEARLESPYDNNHGYTGSTPAFALEYKSPATTCSANIFTAENNETLKAISIFVPFPGEIDIYIYKNISDTPIDDKDNYALKMLNYNVEGNYEEIKLEKEIDIKAGENYSVVVSGIPVYFESDYETSANAGESFLGDYIDGNYYWNDTSKTSFYESFPRNAFIRALTDNAPGTLNTTITDTEISASLKGAQGTIYIAQYDKDGALCQIDIAKSAARNSNVKKIRIFAWDDEMNPVAEIFEKIL